MLTSESCELDVSAADPEGSGNASVCELVQASGWTVHVDSLLKQLSATSFFVLSAEEDSPLAADMSVEEVVPLSLSLLQLVLLLMLSVTVSTEFEVWGWSFWLDLTSSSPLTHCEEMLGLWSLSDDVCDDEVHTDEDGPFSASSLRGLSLSSVDLDFARRAGLWKLLSWEFLILSGVRHLYCANSWSNGILASSFNSSASERPTGSPNIMNNKLKSYRMYTAV